MDIKRSKAPSHKDTSSKGIYGSPKKGGAGGKGTWGKGGADDLIEARVDSKDPNYDSDEEIDKVKKSKKKQIVFKKVDGDSPIQTVLSEYYLSGDLEEAQRRLKEVSSQISLKDFVQYSLIAAMEMHNYERELTSKMLSTCYDKVLSARNISDGFQAALDSLDDTVLDIPQASEMLGKFLARAIVDEVIPPSFLKHAWAENRDAQDALALAVGLTNDSHRIRKLEHIWGPGDMESVKRMKREASSLISDYISSLDKTEADAALRNMNVPHFHFQVVRQAIQMAFSAAPEERKSILDLLAFFYSTGLISSYHMQQGFETSGKFLDDTKLDIPKAPQIFNDLVKGAQEQGFLPVDFKI